MVNVKLNFKSVHEDWQPRVCNDKNSIEDEEHILHCGEFGNDDDDIRFDAVYGDVDKQLKAVKVFKIILRRR